MDVATAREGPRQSLGEWLATLTPSTVAFIVRCGSPPTTEDDPHERALAEAVWKRNGLYFAKSAQTRARFVNYVCESAEGHAEPIYTGATSCCHQADGTRLRWLALPRDYAGFAQGEGQYDMVIANGILEGRSDDWFRFCSGPLTPTMAGNPRAQLVVVLYIGNEHRANPLQHFKDNMGRVISMFLPIGAKVVTRMAD